MNILISFGQRAEREEKAMPMIQVKAAPGRVAYDMPRGGKLIPEDRFVAVPDTPYIRRLINYHKDLILQEAKTPEAPPVPPAEEITPSAA